MVRYATCIEVIFLTAGRPSGAALLRLGLPLGNRGTRYLFPLISQTRNPISRWQAGGWPTLVFVFFTPTTNARVPYLCRSLIATRVGDHQYGSVGGWPTQVLPSPAEPQTRVPYPSWFWKGGKPQKPARLCLTKHCWSKSRVGARRSHNSRQAFSPRKTPKSPTSDTPQQT